MGSLEEEQEDFWVPLGVVSPEKGVNTGLSWKGLTGPPPVNEEKPAAVAAEAVEREEEDSVAFEDEAPLDLPKGSMSVNLTNQGRF